jgi:hypothetical protein
MEFESVGDNDESNETAAPVLAEFDFDPARYVQFNTWIDAELDRLVERWKHLAAPNAERMARFKACRER